MKSKKAWNLNRTIAVVMLIGYCALLVLMLCLDWYLIDGRSKSIMKQEKEMLHTYIKEMEEKMDRVDRIMYDVYSFDNHFESLSRFGTEIEEYSNAYELKETMRQKMVIEQGLHGFYIFYGSEGRSWYHVNTEQISSEKSVQLRTVLEQFSVKNTKGYKTSITTRNWLPVSVSGEEVCMAIRCEKGNVALYAVYGLGEVEKVLKEGSGFAPEVAIVESGISLKNKELLDELHLAPTLQGYTKTFSQKMGEYYVYGEKIGNTEVWVVTAYELNIWRIMSVQQLILLLLTVLSIFVVAALYFFVKKQVVAPIRELTNTMDEIGRGEIQNVPLINVRFREIQKIQETLASMIKSLEIQQTRTVEEAIEKQKAQMQYLQLQLKPHFYLNGLKTLNALTLEKETDKMQDLILNLSAHMRYLLQLDRETVSLAMEIDFVKNYIELQKHVTGRIVICTVQIEKGTEQWMVPVLCVQTFVENSIKYVRLGSEKIPLKIKVEATRLTSQDERFLDITIQDNGQGYTEALLDELNGEIKKSSENVGINNIKRRCQLLYGAKAEHNFFNCDGAVSELIIPEGCTTLAIDERYSKENGSKNI